MKRSGGYDFEPSLCSTKPEVPFWRTYILIFLLYIACFIMCIFQAYILRLRRYIMRLYEPKREKARIGFLHAQIWKERDYSLIGELDWWMRRNVPAVPGKKKQGCLSRYAERNNVRLCSLSK